MLETMLIILEQTATYLPLIAGAYICISTMKVPDLSIESAYMFGAMISAKIIPIINVPSPILVLLAISISMVGGLAVGATSSVITSYGKIPHLLSSILTIGIFHGITQAIAGSYLSLSTVKNPLINVPLFDHHPELIPLVCIACAVLCGIYFLFKTQLGYSYIVYGNNPRFFRYYHISSNYVFVTGIIISNALAGLAGYLNAQTNGFADLNLGLGKALICITSLILGKTLLAEKRFPALTTTSGTFLYFALQQILIKIGFDLKYFATVQACIVLLILLFIYKQKHEAINHLGV